MNTVTVEAIYVLETIRKLLDAVKSKDSNIAQTLLSSILGEIVDLKDLGHTCHIEDQQSQYRIRLGSLGTLLLHLVDNDQSGRFEVFIIPSRRVGLIEFKSDKLHGTVASWNNDGKLLQSSTYRDGALVSTTPVA